MNAHRGNGAGRKPGEWKTVVQGRNNVKKELIKGHGVSNIPNMSDVGSAAYRRLQASTKKKG